MPGKSWSAPKAVIVDGSASRISSVRSALYTFGELGFSLRDARARFEREYIAAVLAQHHGRIPDAAKTLGIQRSNLYRKMRRLKVQPRVKQS